MWIIFPIIFFVIFITAFVFIIINVYKNAKNFKDNDLPQIFKEIDKYTNKSQLPQTKSTKCIYCGSKVDAGEDKCPNCGAPIKSEE